MREKTQNSLLHKSFVRRVYGPCSRLIWICNEKTYSGCKGLQEKKLCTRSIFFFLFFIPISSPLLHLVSFSLGFLLLRDIVCILCMVPCVSHLKICTRRVLSLSRPNWMANCNTVIKYKLIFRFRKFCSAIFLHLYTIPSTPPFISHLDWV